MESNQQEFRYKRAYDITAFSLLVLFVAFFAKSILAIVNAVQTETYNSVVNGLSSL